MKYLKIFVKVFIFFLGTLISLWIFLPWGKIGDYAVLSMEKMVSARGINARHSSVDGSWNGPNIKINGFTAKMALFGGEFATISFAPLYIQSMIQFAPVVSVTFSGAKVSLPGGTDVDLGSGYVEVSKKNDVYLFNIIRSTGELSFDGYIAIDVKNLQIDNADLVIKPPESIESSLSTMKVMIPALIKESEGQWRIKREKSNG